MFSSDRGLVAALAGCLILAIVGLWDHKQSLNYADEQGYQSYRYATDKPLEVDPSINDSANAKALEYREPCKYPKGRDESDLCAQWRAAKAAENSAFWAKGGFWVTIAGAAGLLVTIWQGRVALAKAAEANAITRKQFEASFKPWLSVKAVGPYTDPAQDLLRQFDGPPNQSRWVTIEASVTLTNVTDIPAIIEWVNLFCINETSISINNGGHVEKWIELAKGDSTILSQLDESFAEVSGRTPFGHFHLNAANRDEFLSYYPAICGRILYSDPIGNQRLLGFAFRPQFLCGEKLHRWGGRKYNFDRKVESKEAIALVTSGWSPGNPAREA
jgi:hypothetical protein